MTHTCVRCGAKLDEKLIVWLELDNTTGIYHQIGNTLVVLEENSQGAFPFGSACAQRQLREQEE